MEDRRDAHPNASFPAMEDELRRWESIGATLAALLDGCDSEPAVITEKSPTVLRYTRVSIAI
jgi:hypothetical protein